jgi:hypothetical protein
MDPALVAVASDTVAADGSGDQDTVGAGQVWDVDQQGWQYGDNAWERMSSKGGMGRYTRRRAWFRRAAVIEKVERVSGTDAAKVVSDSTAAAAAASASAAAGATDAAAGCSSTACAEEKKASSGDEGPGPAESTANNNETPGLRQRRKSESSLKDKSDKGEGADST